MADFVIYTDFRTSKYRRSHVIVDEQASVTVWCPAFTEALNHILNAGEQTATIVGDFGKFGIVIRRIADDE